MDGGPKTGDKAPEFTLLDADGRKVSLKDFRGKYVVVYFYPQDETTGCTIEALEFTKMEPDFTASGVKVLGISKDSCESHAKFAKHRKLSVTLLSDPDKAALNLYGVWKPVKFMGREFLGTARTTFLVNPSGKIVKVWEKVNPLGHARAVLDEAKKQASAKKGKS